jgi:hypothetical protein
MLLILRPLIVELVLLHENIHYVIPVNVIQMVMRFNDCSSASVRHMAHINAGGPQTVQTWANEDAIIAAVKWAHAISHDNGTIPSKCVRSTLWWSIASILLVECTSVARWLSSMDAVLQMAMRSTHFYVTKACFTCEGVFHIHNSHLWTWDNPHAIHKHGYQVRFSFGISVGIIRDIIVGPYLIPNRLPAQWYHNFLDSLLTGRVENLSAAVRHRLWFQHDGAPVHDGEGIWQWLNVKYPGRWIRCWGPIVISYCGTPKGAHLCRPYRDYQRSCGMTYSSCDNGWCQHVKECLKECHATHCCLPWNGWRPFQTPIVMMRHPQFDHLIAFAISEWHVSRRLNVTGHMLYTILDLFFFLTLKVWRACGQISFHPVYSSRKIKRHKSVDTLSWNIQSRNTTGVFSTKNSPEYFSHILSKITFRFVSFIQSNTIQYKLGTVQRE